MMKETKTMTVSPLELNRKILQLNDDLDAGDASNETLAKSALVLAASATALAAALAEDMEYKEGVWKYMRNSLGIHDAIADYSTLLGDFAIFPPDNVVYDIERLIVSVQCAANSFRFDRYGGITALGTGIRVYHKRDGVIVKELTDNVPIKTSAGWGNNCFDDEPRIVGAGTDFFQVRWTFGKSGTPLRLDGSQKEKLEVLLKDDMTGLVSQTFKVDGKIV